MSSRNVKIQDSKKLLNARYFCDAIYSTIRNFHILSKDDDPNHDLLSYRHLYIHYFILQGSFFSEQNYANY